MKASKKLKKLVSRLDLLKEEIDNELEHIIDNREDIFMERTERWKNGKFGETFYEETERIDDLKNEIKVQFEFIFNELNEFENL